MDNYDSLRVISFCLAVFFSVFVIFFDAWQKKWKRLILDIFVFFVQMPFWIMIWAVIVRIFPGLIYSYFSGIWLLIGLLLWITPHSIMSIRAIYRKRWMDALCSIAGASAIGCFAAFVFFWDMAKNNP